MSIQPPNSDLSSLNSADSSPKLDSMVQQRTSQLEQALEFEAMLKRITDKVRDSLDETQIWQTAVRELTVVLGIKGCNASLYDLEKGTSTICSEYAATIPAIHGRVAKLAKFPELYKQLLRGQYFQFCSLLPNPERGRSAMLACPIFDNQGVLGDLWLVHHADYEFSELELRLVQQVANQCAIAIRQARLFQSSQAQVQELEKLNNLKDDFLSTVSHELRTPVSNMKMAIRMLNISLERYMTAAPPESGNTQQEALEKKVNHYLQILGAECEREINLINDLLDLQRLENQEAPSDLDRINLVEFMDKILPSFRDRAHSRQQHLSIEIADDIPDFLSETFSLERVIAELLNNACKYTPPDESIQFKAWLEQPPEFLPADPERVVSNRPKLWIEVKNTGIDISQSELDRIFDKFYRIPSADPWKQGGTGLGLALVKKLSERLGGKIQVNSGSAFVSFTVVLPIQTEHR
ncbi:GAF domain-containing sensor histidine kinase [Roseofilum capinflatum]|uniref:histidine kinase n=1 Tax=Roseofilum capinflatum BLCC-M114 TaxID=3022440 RepID=A0ABT7BDM6_9CYAN|nr:HAMP domain-containing sensor histidine kinase [Roseofilum capinflatum]MDJ1177185.1 HAMP domain-containing sensor histidine kinase [Roseofilum capinflatum BLCC-M114]